MKNFLIIFVICCSHIFTDGSSIVYQPQDITVLEMASALFVCQGTAYSQLKWVVNGPGKTNMLAVEIKQEDRHISVYKVRRVTLKMNNTIYSCYDQKQPETKFSARLYVKPKNYKHLFPTKDNPKVRVAEIDKIYMLHCPVNSPQDSSIQWYRNDKPLDLSDSRYNVLENGTLQISKVRSSDSGRYSCSRTNQVGTTLSDDFQVYTKVRKVPPSFSKRPSEEIRVIPGSKLNITCSANGKPKPVVQFLNLTTGRIIPNTYEADYTAAIVIRNILTPMHLACIAKNEDDEQAMYNFTISLKKCPLRPTEVTVSDILSSSARVRWKEFGKSVIYLKKAASSGDEIREEIKSSEFQLSDLDPFTTYIVRISRRNEQCEGTLSDPVKFTTAEGRPSAPRNLTGRVIGSIVVLRFYAPLKPNGIITHYRLRYKRMEDNKHQWITKENIKVNDTLTGLVENAIYDVIVYAVNSQGYGDASNQLRIKFSDGDKSDVDNHTVAVAVPYIDAKAISPHSIRVVWKKPLLVKTQDILKFEVKVVKLIGEDSPISLHINPNQYDAEIPNLEPNTDYGVSIVIYDRDRREGPESEVVSVRTAEAAPDYPPIITYHEKVASTMLAFSYDQPKNSGANGKITCYTIYYKLLSYKADPIQTSPPNQINGVKREIITDLTSKRIDLKGLKPWSWYAVWMSANTSSESPFSKPYLARTGEDVPMAPPSHIMLKAINATAIYIKWKNPKESELRGLLIGTQIVYKEHIEPVSGEKVDSAIERYVNIKSDFLQNFTLGNLIAETKYAVFLRSRTSKGFSPDSEVKYVKTTAKGPTAPEYFEGGFSRAKQLVHLQWEKPSDWHSSNKTKWQYRLTYKDTEGRDFNTIFLNYSVTEFTLSRLIPSTLYKFELRAMNEHGVGEPRFVNMRVEMGLPGKPLNPRVYILSYRKVLFKWNPPPPPYTNLINSYEIRYDLNKKEITKVNISAQLQYFYCEALKPGLTYNFEVAACNALGCGEFTDAQPITTMKKVSDQAPRDVKAVLNGKSIVVTWKKPTLGDPFKYIVYYTNNPSIKIHFWNNKTVEGSLTTILSNLKFKTTYAIKVQSVVDSTVDALSPVVLQTVSGGSIYGFKIIVNNINNDSVLISWPKPSSYQKVSFYSIGYYNLRNGLSKYINSIPNTVHIQYIEDLKPNTKYRIILKETFADLQNHSVETDVLTKYQVPYPISPPEITQLKSPRKTRITFGSLSNILVPNHMIFVIAARESVRSCRHIPTLAFTKKDLLRFYTSGSDHLHDDRCKVVAAFVDQLPSFLDLGDNGNYSGFINHQLTAPRYSIFITMMNLNEPDSLIYSEYTEEFTPAGYFAMGSTQSAGIDPAMNLMWVVGVIASCIFLIVGIILGIYVYRRKRTIPQENGVYKYNIPPSYTPLKVFNSEEPRDFRLMTITNTELANHPALAVHEFPDHVMRLKSNGGTMLSREFEVTNSKRLSFLGMTNHQPVSTNLFADHCERLRANNHLILMQEFKSIEPGQQFHWDHSLIDVNRDKNRFANVIAYDHTRVILSSINGIPESDYINANLIDGFRNKGAYIAAQAPLKNTVVDFWRMIWEKGVPLIIMLTRLVEKGRSKCDQYWPDELKHSEQYGFVTVIMESCDQLAYHTIRCFSITNRNFPNSTRRVRHLQYTGWPEHGVPEHPTSFLSFIYRARHHYQKICSEDQNSLQHAASARFLGPVLVHCSAGVGRTGVFIEVDSQLDRMETEKTLDIYGHVTYLRAQRQYMVQTEEQYMFIHDALLEAIQCPSTLCEVGNFYSFYKSLKNVSQGEMRSGMEKEFERLAKVALDPEKFVSANRPVNRMKNRFSNILPFENSRVCLQPIRGVDGSDYINASFFDGDKSLNAYIATQAPLENTVADFWRMLWEHNSSIIVMLTKLTELGRSRCHQYWPDYDKLGTASIRYNYLVVEALQEFLMPYYAIREFRVTDARDGKSRTIRQFHYDWPEQGVPKAIENFIDFMGQVHNTKTQFGLEGPITVHCSGGAGRTGVFIALKIVLEMIRIEGLADVFQTVKMLRCQRPAMVQSEDQYQFIYKAAIEYLGSFDMLNKSYDSSNV